MYKKQDVLRGIIKSYGVVAVAYSSGVDSTYLLKIAVDTLGVDKVLALTARSAMFPKREYDEANDFCKKYGIRQIVVEIDEREIDGLCDNPRNRCYLCKKAIFSRFIEIAKREGIETILEGSNIDDLGDYRPGMMAIAELEIKSPLKEAGLGKEEIRLLSKKLGLATYDKPSFACLASRFVYGERIDREKLAMVEKAEELLDEMGFIQRRVRIHGRLARIEVMPEDIERIMLEENRDKIYRRFIELGFTHVALDLKGYKLGSMNA